LLPIAPSLSPDGGGGGKEFPLEFDTLNNYLLLEREERRKK
jgi:hypothetical protein